MAVQPHRTAWTDERLDDLAQSVRDGFAQANIQNRDLKTEIGRRFDQNDAEHKLIRKEMGEGFTVLRGQMLSLHRTIVAGSLAIIGTMLAYGLGWF